jgi:myo-inositol-1(or 4)-monophosphatase
VLQLLIFVTVAMGAADGYFESSLKEWDFAAGGLIATEAGAIIRSFWWRT